MATGTVEEEATAVADLVLNLTYECNVCSKNFKSAGHLKKHHRTHEVQRHSCGICSKAFAEKYNLKTHMLTHTRERPHVCSQCLKTFRCVF